MMQILHTSYEANKEAALEGLEHYYAEALEVAGETAPEFPTAYQEVNGQVSLEAHNSGSTVGRLLATYDDLTNSIRIDFLFVEKWQRGQNIGGLLIKHLEQDARSKSVQMMFVDTTLASAPDFYRKQGFEVIGQIENYPVLGDTYILMMKRL
ncbi:GNAT family N-acetyltransferase [Paracoccus broussonetiae]|uniref:GNAT family N-acetyltransferase n=1 Tax=Paracoccus broussonetiae subsp. drimophilus TaxID=3373869 RepID=A0ABW7LNS7_9RHOB